jgi:hypothetical protein
MPAHRNLSSRPVRALSVSGLQRHYNRRLNGGQFFHIISDYSDDRQKQFADHAQ